MALGEESWAAGGAMAYGTRSNAIGNGAVNTYKGNEDTAEKSIAIGYQATADTAGTISFGHDAGDASGYQVKWHKRTDGQRNPDGTYNDYTQAPESITETHYDSAQYNRLVKVADGIDDHDAVVMEQLKSYVKTDDLTALDNQVAANAGNIFNLDNRVGELGSRINKVGAGAAALAALHPLDFDPSDKWDFAAGVGNYRNETAAAVGLFYRPNARSMFNLGWTMGDNRNMVNGGFSIKLGKGSVYNDMSKAQMAETIATQSKEISAMKADNAAIKADYDALKADNEAKEKRIDALEKQMQEIMAKLGK